MGVRRGQLGVVVTHCAFILFAFANLPFVVFLISILFLRQWCYGTTTLVFVCICIKHIARGANDTLVSLKIKFLLCILCKLHRIVIKVFKLIVLHKRSSTVVDCTYDVYFNQSLDDHIF